MATPVASGSAPLIRQYFAEGWHGNGSRNSALGFSAQASLIKAVILNGGRALQGIETDLAQVTSSQPYDPNQGFGRIDLLSSLPIVGKNDLNAVFINDRAIEEGDTQSYEVVPKGNCSRPLSAMLVWTDPAGAPFCNQGCVLNDLDLSIIQGGEIFYPNGLHGKDSVNNAERVQISSPATGASYTINVQGASLLAAQSYSLVITGCFSIPNDGATAEGNQTVNPCQDNADDFAAGDSALRTCAWLADNITKYGYLCDFSDVANKCPVSCDRCNLLSGQNAGQGAGQGTDLIARAPLTGKTRWYGNKFNVDAKSSLPVNGFDVIINKSGSYRIQVSTHEGSIEDPTNDWVRVCDTVVISSGSGTTTTIPDSDCKPVAMAAGSRRGFFVTLLESPEFM